MAKSMHNQKAVIVLLSLIFSNLAVAQTGQKSVPKPPMATDAADEAVDDLNSEANTAVVPTDGPAPTAPSPAEDQDPADVSGGDGVNPEDLEGGVPPPVEPQVSGGGGVGVPQVESAPTQFAKPEPLPSLIDAPDSSTRSIIEKRRKRHREAFKQPMFGAYRVHIGAIRPTFDNQDQYKTHYGDPSYMPSLGVDYFAFDWYATLGMAFKVGYYKDTGYTLKRENGALVKDKNGKTELTLVPLQIAAAAEFTPFTGKWVVLSGWAGLEYLYFQEVRKNSSSTSSSTESTTTTTSTTSSSSDDTKLFMTSGWRKSTLLGMAASFRIDWADGQSAGSMESYGLRNVYLTPFFEILRSADGEALNFQRKNIGLMFTFESIK